MLRRTKCPICQFDAKAWYPLPLRMSGVASALAGATQGPQARLERHMRSHTPQEWLEALEKASATSNLPGPEEIADMAMKEVMGIYDDMDGEVHERQRQMGGYAECLEFGYRLHSLIRDGVAD